MQFTAPDEGHAAAAQADGGGAGERGGWRPSPARGRHSWASAFMALVPAHAMAGCGGARLRHQLGAGLRGAVLGAHLVADQGRSWRSRACCGSRRARSRRRARLVVTGGCAAPVWRQRMARASAAAPRRRVSVRAVRAAATCGAKRGRAAPLLWDTRVAGGASIACHVCTRMAHSQCRVTRCDALSRSNIIIVTHVMLVRVRCA